MNVSKMFKVNIDPTILGKLVGPTNFSLGNFQGTAPPPLKIK